MQGFSRPKVYDPSAANRAMQQPRTTSTPSNPSQTRRDLGFEEQENMDVDLEERSRELAEQVRKLRAQIKELQTAASEAKESESLSARKLQSFQQVNRSQNTLMRGELSKCRRRLAHREQVCLRLREQMEWFQSSSPSLKLPQQLQGLPEEESCADEAADLAQHHQRWEKDVAQLAEQIKMELGGSLSSAAPAVSSQQSSEFETLAKQQQKEMARQAEELQQLRRELQLRHEAKPNHMSEPNANASMEVAALQQELEAKKEEAKEHVKKLKQLATAYKQLDQGKKDAEAKLAATEKALETSRSDVVANARLPKKAQISPALVHRVRSILSAEKEKIHDLRTALISDYRQIPSIVQQAMMPKLQKIIDAGCNEWKDKYMVEYEKRKKLHNLVQELKGNIRVYVRVRPLNAQERASCISFPSPDEVCIRNDELGTKKTWEFNHVFKEDSTQADVFKDVRDLIVSMLDGFNVCIFAYGQTGSGKTHSMQGYGSDVGIYQRTFKELFAVQHERRETVKIELQASITEIYNEDIRDLLSKDREKRLQIKQNKEEGIHVPGLTKKVVSSPDDVEVLLAEGQKNRSTASTDMNLHSSRSHLLVQIYGSMTTTAGKRLHSCITLVDLAGSERLAKSGVTGDRAKEAISINKSLSALGDVINARATKSSHTPFRNSTLTHLLQESLVGDSKTLMLLQLNPCSDYADETLCSIQFGARVNAVEMSTGKK